MLSCTESSTFRCVSEGDSNWGTASTKDRFSQLSAVSLVGRSNISIVASELPNVVARGTPAQATPGCQQRMPCIEIQKVRVESLIQRIQPVVLRLMEKVAPILLTRVEKVECHGTSRLIASNTSSCIGASVLNPNRLIVTAAGHRRVVD